MKNPWLQSHTELFTKEEKYYGLKDEIERIQIFNKKLTSSKQFKLHIQPEPYLGSFDAPVYLLNLNPGYKNPLDEEFLANEIAMKLWKQNLFQELKDYPFYMLHKDIEKLKGGPEWWLRTLRDFINFNNSNHLKEVSSLFCCLEFFPYHSTSYIHFPYTLESQKFNFFLVEQAIEENKMIIIMRAEKMWCTAVPSLANYSKCFALKNPRSSKLSIENLGEDNFNSIIKETELK